MDVEAQNQGTPMREKQDSALITNNLNGDTANGTNGQVTKSSDIEMNVSNGIDNPTYDVLE